MGGAVGRHYHEHTLSVSGWMDVGSAKMSKEARLSVDLAPGFGLQLNLPARPSRSEVFYPPQTPTGVTTPGPAYGMPRAPRFMPLLLLLLLLSLPHTQAAFPQDPLPLLTSDLQGTQTLRPPDHVFSFDLQAQEEGEGLVPNKYLTWRSQDMENCAVRGKLTDECYNYIRVLVPWDSQTLLACGTNSFSPVCRSYGITSLQQEGEELSGQARCPFDATQSNVAIFAEPHFVHALEHGDHVYFFFREVQFSRVARVCKRDMGGSPRALDRHWTSFLKLRLNCSVPGDSTFYFDVLQALTGPVNLYGRSALFGVFTTQTNSIPGSAVCAFYLDDIERGFEGKFKEQRSLDGAWTPVSEDRVPSPRPGSCAGVGVAALFPSSRDLPDDVLTFIKAHPLLDPAVPPATHQPLLTLTSRALLTQVAVDGMAGPYSNTTVLFLGSNDGTVLKVLPPWGQSGGPEPILLEEIDAYSPSRCSGKRAAQTARRVIGLELDTEGHRLFVAFSGCVIYLPLSRCARHGACRRIDVHPAGNQESMEHDDCQGVRRDLPPASVSRSVPIPLLLACVAAAFALGASVSGLLVSCACRRAHRRRSKDIETAGLPRPLSLRSLAPPRLGVGGSRRLPFSTHRAPPALLTRVPSGGPSRYSGGAGRHLLYLGRPEGHRGRALKRVDVEKPQVPLKPPLVGPSSQPAVPSGNHFNF
ncbi:hypothetical protein E2I00_018236 [Balaenoptera physalus]|uniref:Sema domain-containing protein n=1 Tax=Balaenoptera physalus TaxID=9770 RepID=A0A643CB76_BALPH|nr:hypothetical protein E2I00_018236 [Balaenoptera physalus]